MPDLGMVCVAGLLNALAMIDVYSYWEERTFGAGTQAAQRDAAPSVLLRLRESAEGGDARMIDPLVHLLLFLAVVAVIVTVARFFFTTDDAKALRGTPRRIVKFLFWCGFVVGLMLLAEHTVASVS
jgi:hypothetical protein